MKIDCPLNKTQFICDKLEKEIRSGTFKPGTRLASMRALCDRFDVSIAVINSVYNHLEKQGLIERRIGSGTYISLPPEKRGKVFGILTSIQSRFMDGYYHAILEAGNESGQTVIPQYLAVGQDPNPGIDRVLAQNPAAVLLDLEGPQFDLAAIRHRLGNTPVCFVNRYEWDVPLNNDRAVLIDYSGMIDLALKKFRASGHRRILYLSHENEPWPFEFRMLECAAKQNGLTFPSMDFSSVGSTDFTENRTRLNIFFGTENYPTALICRGDSTLYNFTVKLRVLYPHLKKLELLGCFDTVWSNLPENEFRSFTVDFKRVWLKAFSLFNTPQSRVEYYLPDWPEKKQIEEESSK